MGRSWMRLDFFRYTLFFLVFLFSCGTEKFSNTKQSIQSKKEFKADPNIHLSFVIPETSGNMNINEVSSMKLRSGVRKKSDSDKDDKRIAKKARKNRNNELLIEKESESGRKLLGIRKNALDKEFLLRANVIQGDESPDFHNLKSRVIAFSQRGNRLYLLEATQGHAYYHDLPLQFILADFKIHHEDEKNEIIYFDFGKGMSKLYTIEDWYAHDFMGSEYPGVEAQFQSSKVDHSFVDLSEASLNEGYLYIRQIAQMKIKGGSLPVEVRYYFEPYEPNLNFNKIVSPKRFDHYGFFEINPSISASTQRPVTYASKFDIDKPIVFAISSNTPEEYKQVIKEGVMYWNKSFGREVVKTIDAPTGITAPQYNYNMIQWIEWDEATGAYADAQMDPRTGEVLNAQIYLSSVFAINGEQKARKLLRKLINNSMGQGTSENSDLERSLSKIISTKDAEGLNKLLDVSHQKPKKARLSLKGFASHPLCEHSHIESLANSMMQLLTSGASHDQYKKLSHDYLRGVVAHEVGHTLGLRHNFAGSLAANYEVNERDQIMSSYIEKSEISEDLIVSSSVMDYLVFDESVIVGNQVKSNKEALSYDKMAIEILYLNKDIQDYNDPALFCTDSHMSKYVDCKIWNIGRSPLEYSQYLTKKNISEVAVNLAEYFISNVKSISPDDEKLPYDHVLLSSYYQAMELLRPRMRALETLQPNKRALWLDREYSYVTDGNYREIDEKFAQWVDSEVTRLGEGQWDKILNHVPENFAEMVSEKFDSIIESDHYRQGVGPEGAYKFSENEISQMKSAVKSYVKELEKSLTVVDLIQLHKIKPISDHEVNDEGKQLDDDYVKFLANKVKKIILETKNEPEDQETPLSKSTLLKAFREATVTADTEEEFVKKLYIIKTMLEEQGPFTFDIDDAEDTEIYLSKELDRIATKKLNEFLNQMTFLIDLSAEITSAEKATAEGEHSGSDSDEEDYSLSSAGSSTSDDSEGSDVSGSKSGNVQGEDDEGSVSSIDSNNSQASSISQSSNISQVSSRSNESDSSGDPKFSIGIPVTLKLQVNLTEFKNHYLIRMLAGLLLDTKRGESLAFAMKDRETVASEFKKFFLSQIKYIPIERENLSKQTKLLNSWYQENEGVLAILNMKASW